MAFLRIIRAKMEDTKGAQTPSKKIENEEDKKKENLNSIFLTEISLTIMIHYVVGGKKRRKMQINRCWSGAGSQPVNAAGNQWNNKGLGEGMKF